LISFTPFTKIIGGFEGQSKEKIQLSTCSPVISIQEDGDLIKYVQKFQVCLYGADTQMFEIREFDVVWNEDFDVYATIVGMRTLMHNSKYEGE